MRVLVTGATGFIGQALCARLRADGVFVRAAVRRIGVSTHADEVITVGEINESTDWSAAVDSIDTVFHIAGVAHIKLRNSTEIQRMRATNVDGTASLLGAVSRAARFIFVSTAKVHGDASGMRPFVETDPFRPADDYSRSKSDAELLVRRSSSLFTIVRPPLVYGPRVRANFLELLRAADRGMPLPIGAIENKRSFVYLGNLVDALVLFARSPASVAETYFVSDGEDLSTSALVRRIAQHLGRAPRIFSIPVPLLRSAASAIGKRQALEKLASTLEISTRKAHEQVGWSPPFSLDEGLAETIRWYRETVARQKP